MVRTTRRIGALGALCFFLVLTSHAATLAQQPPAAYPRMAPLSQYLIADRASEIALARSAAPTAISGKATIQVLGSSGYITAVKGSNGFVCIVERSWLSPFDSSQFWNPKLRGPDCYNPEAVKSILPIVYRLTALALRGLSRHEIRSALETDLTTKQLPSLAPGAMCYMMSRQQLIGTPLNHWLPHLMFYTRRDVDWGAGVTGSPIMSSPQFRGGAIPIKGFLIPLGKWSDGTTAPAR